MAIIRVDPKRTGIKVLVRKKGEHAEYEVPGTVRFNVKDYVFLACPGCGRMAAMRVGDPKPEETPSWRLTGDPDKPETLTMHPSINCKGCCGWHGWLEDGVFSLSKKKDK